VYKGLRVAVVVPAHNESRHVGDVVKAMPGLVDAVTVVDDGSIDDTFGVARAAADERTTVVRFEQNRGVGGAIVEGHRLAMEVGADVSVVIAGDGQMDPDYLPSLLDPIADSGYEFTKANRFFAIGSFDGMPRMRIVGNIVMSFLTKAASGYWHLFDPQNGYTAIHRSALERLPLKRLRERFEFENDLLIHMNIARVRATDVPIPARYGEEVSDLRLMRDVRRILTLLAVGFWRRIWWKYIVQSFSPVALLLLFGLALVAAGLAIGAFVVVNSIGPPTASTATVLMSVAPLLTGIHLLVSALLLDIQDSQR
jgi:glycosyltransferase involved in cell wall biosynthesis